MNLDGGDYHPLFGQRDTIGFDQLTDVVELADKNFAAILSENGAVHGAGTLAVINRSVGVDQLSDNPDDYTQRPDAITWPNPSFYQHSLRVLDPAATGKLAGTQARIAVRPRCRVRICSRATPATSSRSTPSTATSTSSKWTPLPARARR